MRYGQNWRDHRTTFNQHFRQSVVNIYEPQQQAVARAFLRKVLSTESTAVKLEEMVHQ